MEICYPILISLALSLAVFSVSLKMGFFRCHSRREIFLSSFLLTFFLTGLLSLGWLISHSMKAWLDDYKNIPGIIILVLLGFKTMYFSMGRKTDPSLFDTGNRSALIAIAFASGMNGLLAGLALPFLGVGLFPLIMVLPLLVFIIAPAGFILGKMAGKVYWTQWIELTCGLFFLLVACLELLKMFNAL